MDDKLKRECKGFVEKTFKKYEKFGSGAMSKDDVKKLLKIVIPDYNQKELEVELNELLANYIKDTKYTAHNRKTNQFEVKYLDNTVDFPSVLAICIHFLKKIEKDPNVFSGRQVVKVNHFPAADLKTGNDQKKLF